MRFELDEDQRDFAAALESLLSGAGTVAAARAWAEGDHAPGLGLWKRLADLGVLSLATDASPVEVAIAFEALGRHAVPGPWVESAAYLPIALGREVEGVATVALPPHVPYALDADVADEVYVGASLATGVGERVTSVDRTRRLFRVEGAASDSGESDREAIDLASTRWPTCASRSTSRGRSSTVRHSVRSTSPRPSSRPGTRRTSPPASACRCTAPSDTPPSSTCRCG